MLWLAALFVLDPRGVDRNLDSNAAQNQLLECRKGLSICLAASMCSAGITWLYVSNVKVMVLWPRSS